MSQSNIVVVNPPYPNINGVKNTVALKIVQMLNNGIRYFGSPGASLTHHANNPDYDSAFKHKVVRIGLEGERSTSSLLQQWIQDKPNAVLIDSVHIRGMGKEEIDPESGMIEGGDTDHVLIIGNHVFLIDTKRWKERRKYSINDKGQILRSDRIFPGGRVRAAQARALWKKYLHPSATVSSIICINADKTFVKMDSNWKKQSYRLYTVDKLPDYLNYRYQQLDEINKTHINSTLVSQIAVCCIKPFDPYSRVFDMNSLNKFR
jgi:hypothetical protein